MFLARAEQVIEKRDIQFQDFDEFDNSSIRDVEFAIEVERTGITIRTEFCDLSIIDVSRQFRRVLVLLVLWLERADSDTILFAHDDSLHAHILNNSRPIAFIFFHPLREHESAIGTEVTLHVDVKINV